MRNKGIPYLEANGNIFIQKENFYLFVDGQRIVQQSNEKGNRAFTKTGLKVLFYFLQNNELVNQPQRMIAEETGVGLGNIPQVIEGLKETEYLLTLDKNTYTWENRYLM